MQRRNFYRFLAQPELLSTQKTRSVCSESTRRQQRSRHSPQRGETGEERRASGASSTRRRVPGGPRPAGASDEARRLESGGRSGCSSVADARDVCGGLIRRGGDIPLAVARAHMSVRQVAKCPRVAIALSFGLGHGPTLVSVRQLARRGLAVSSLVRRRVLQRQGPEHQRRRQERPPQA